MSLDLGKLRAVTAGDYHGADALSHSKMEVYRKRKRLYQRRYVLNIKRPEREAHKFRIGTALHAAAEGVDAFTRLVSVNTSFTDFKKKEAQLWRDDVYASGKGAALLGEEADRVGQMFSAVQEHPFLGPFMLNAESETTWRATHPKIPVPLQCRTDIYSDGTIVDLKSCTSLDEGDFANFQRSFEKFGYHRQAAWYREILRLCGVKMKQFVFGAVEDDEPFGVQAFRVSEEAMDIGDLENGDDLSALIESYRTNDWPNAPTDVREINLSDWYVRRNAA